MTILRSPHPSIAWFSGFFRPSFERGGWAWLRWEDYWIWGSRVGDEVRGLLLVPARLLQSSAAVYIIFICNLLFVLVFFLVLFFPWSWNVRISRVLLVVIREASGTLWIYSILLPTAHYICNETDTSRKKSVSTLRSHFRTWARMRQYNIAAAQNILYRRPTGPPESPHWKNGTCVTSLFCSLSLSSLSLSHFSTFSHSIMLTIFFGCYLSLSVSDL